VLEQNYFHNHLSLACIKVKVSSKSISFTGFSESRM